MKKYQVRVTETGSVIDNALSLEKALSIITDYENEDKENDNFRESFYEIYDTESKEIVY